TARPRKLSGRPSRHDLAAEQDDDAVTDELDLAQQVRVEQHGDAAPLQLLEQRPHGTPPNRIEGARRFVEKQQPRRPDERLGDPARAPHTSARPDVGRTRPHAILTRVDFPAPFGPSRPTSSLSPTSRSTPLSASTAP